MNNRIENFIKKFYGYGSFKDKYWFVGMEEGMSAKTPEEQIKEFEHRLLCWENRDQRELEELKEYHRCLAKNCKNIDCFFENGKPPLQRTWSKLIRLQLAADGKKINNEEIRKYQRKGLPETCLIELFPLPSKSIGEWIYSDYAKGRLSFLKSRKEYRAVISEQRISFIKEKIKEKKPKVVICYGWTYRNDYYRKLNNSWKDEEHFLEAKIGKTLCFIIKHPVSKGITNYYFEKIGKRISGSKI